MHPILQRLAGLLIAAFGAVFLLYLYAFCSLIHPDYEGWDRQAEILRRMFLRSDPGIGSYLGVVIVLGGFILMFGPRRWHR